MARHTAGDVATPTTYFSYNSCKSNPIFELNSVTIDAKHLIGFDPRPLVTALAEVLHPDAVRGEREWCKYELYQRLRPPSDASLRARFELAYASLFHPDPMPEDHPPKVSNQVERRLFYILTLLFGSANSPTQECYSMAHAVCNRTEKRREVSIQHPAEVRARMRANTRAISLATGAPSIHKKEREKPTQRLSACTGAGACAGGSHHMEHTTASCPAAAGGLPSQLCGRSRRAKRSGTLRTQWRLHG